MTEEIEERKEEKKQQVVEIPTEGEKGQRFCKMAMIALIFDANHNAHSRIALYMRDNKFLREIMIEQGFSEEEINEFGGMIMHLEHIKIANHFDYYISKMFAGWDDGRV